MVAPVLEPVVLGPTWKKVPDWRERPEEEWYCLPSTTLGWQIIRWIEENLLADEGTPFLLTFEQKRFILWWYAVDDDGRFTARKGVLQRLKGWGKDPLGAAICAVELVGPCRFDRWILEDMPEADLVAGDPLGVEHPRAWIQIAAVSKDQPLALGTRVRTPRGWTTVEKLGVGDQVYDERGQAQLVQRETEVFNDLDCYRLVLDDGQEVVASAEHGWTVERKRLKGDYHVTETLTTRQLAEGYLDSKGGRRIRIPVVPVDSPDVELPIDPYLLGLWLGDGNRNNGTIAIDWRVRDEVEKILTPLLTEHERLVFTHVADHTGSVNIRNVSRHGSNGPALIQRLRALGVLHDKHIPEQYAFAGTQQRRALLQGLIDSDGCVLPDGQVRFTNVDWGLIEGVRDLVASLGYKAHVRRHGTAGWIVGFRPDERPVARLRHKVSRQRPWGKPQPQYRYIERVERIESVPVKCIGIDTPAHLFQVEGGILTHNTRNTMTLFPGMFTKECISRHNIDIGKQIIYAHGGMRRIEAVTSSPRALEGGRATFVLCNETHHWLSNNEGHEMMSVIDRNVTKAKGGAARALSITNGYEPSEDSVAQRQREAWENEIAGLVISTGVMYDSLEAPPEARIGWARNEDGSIPTDEEVRAYISAVVEIVRGDAVWLDIPSIVNAILDANNSPSTSRRFYYNQIVATEDTWLHPDAAKAAIDPLAADARAQLAADPLRAGWLVMPSEPIVMFFDGSKSDDSTALTGTVLDTGYTFTIGVWQKPPGDAGKHWTAPRDLVDVRVHEAFKRFNIVAFWADPSHTRDDDGSRYWDGLIDAWHNSFKDRLQVWAVKTGDQAHAIMWDMTSPERQAVFVAAAELFVEELETEEPEGVYAPQFRIDGHPALMDHLRNAKKYPTKWGVSLFKGGRESAKKIDLAVCAVGSRMLRRIVVNRGLEEEKKKKAGQLWGVGPVERPAQNDIDEIAKMMGLPPLRRR